ncbi:MAG: glucuronate isomerase [bacterium]|nr:glucuronate isomerase [bacterium]
MKHIHLPEDRYFGPDPGQKKIAAKLYERVKDKPLVCPHGHVDPRLFSDPDYDWGTPVDLLIIPDHYVFRMLYSQGVPVESLGVPRRDGGPVEKDHRKIWRAFAERFHLFRGTPSGCWLSHELVTVFGVTEKPSAESADRIYDRIAECLASPEFRPRRLFERFRIETLATTDAATDTLEHHKAIRESGWKGNVIPTFRPDAVVNLDAADWAQSVRLLGERSGIAIRGYRDFIAALENRRAFFKSMGASATDHAAVTAHTEILSESEAEAIFGRALAGRATAEDAFRFTGHMLVENARMSVEDGLVMQLHTGSFRNHNQDLYAKFGPDKGADIPVQGEFTRSLRPLLSRFGNDSRLTLVLFTLDETVYSRELAPLAGHYPALKLGPAWWFHDSLNGMMRYREQVMETAGLYNTTGFIDDTRAFPSIPARHDLSRRVDANWIAGLVVRGIVDEEDAEDMIEETAYRLAKRAFKM